MQFSPLYTASREWIRLSSTIQNSLSVSTFKSLFKDKIANPYTRLSNSRQGICGIWLARLHMELSPLKHSHFRFNFIPYTTCPMCNTSAGTNHHFFFHCPSYLLAHITIFRSLREEHWRGVYDLRLFTIILYINEKRYEYMYMLAEIIVLSFITYSYHG